MTAPDPNGCKRCGSVECPLPAANRRPGAWTRGSEAWVAALAAARDCESRPAVDWQAECRRLVSERRDAASRPAPVEVRGVVVCADGDDALVQYQGAKKQEAAWLPISGARVGQRVTVTVTPEG